MSKIALTPNGSGSGVFTIASPNSNTNRTITLPDESVTLGAGTPSIDDNGNATAITIDSNENVLITKTATGIATVGSELKATGELLATVNNDACAFLNRKSSDGDIINLRKDGSTVGAIQARSSFTTLQIGSTGTGITGTSSHKILPSVNNARSDNTNDLGDSSYRWKDAYLSGGVYLGGTGSANKLDDYESGAWTPNVGGNATYSVQSGSYIKIGKIVFIYGEIRISSIGTGTINFLSGLPFNGNAEHTINISKLVNSTTSVYYANLRTSGASLYLAYQNALDGTWTNNPSFLTTSTEIQFSGTYETDA